MGENTNGIQTINNDHPNTELSLAKTIKTQPWLTKSQ
ncbi:hypothetical protein Xenpb_02616 [Xenorhabdus sp. PB62.4]|nr:hypothetical protein [Xenorhabdus sp. PB62.4]